MTTTPPVPSSLALLAELVKRPTISADSNLGLVQFVAEFLSQYGISSKLIFTEDGQKANLIAVVGPADRPGVMLSGHTDVVPVRGQPWTGDPFELREQAGLAIGRGVVDMKGFIACALRSAALASQRALAHPIVLALSHDEEIGCVGVRRMIPRLAELPARPFLCVVGEPTDMNVVTAHKGKVMGRIACTGIDGHSSDPDAGVNAIFLASEMVDAARQLQATLQQPERSDPAFTVPHSTLHIGVIRGGAVLNIIPRECLVEFEIRTLPHVDQDALIASLQAAADRIAARYQDDKGPVSISVQVQNAYPALSTSDQDPGVYFVQRLVNRNGTGKVAFGSEAGLFQRELDIPTVVCGPGSVTQAHKPDEHVQIAQLDACDAFLDRLVDRLAAGVPLEGGSLPQQGAWK
jgi:acetylornithine deacetylase